jgi:hypothetical protein
MYRYRLGSTGTGSKYGNCEVCDKPVSEVFQQSEEKSYQHPVIGEGWAHVGNTFGHEECLIAIRKEGNQ